jgi:hypothetical protein
MNGVVPSCYPSCTGVSWIYIQSNGSFSGGITSGAGYSIIYDSSALIDRICIPSTATLTHALSGVVNTLSSAANSGTFANFINDLKYVNN